jgi:colanic acid/amylovoran biosynthesis glycosyltransferase
MPLRIALSNATPASRTETFVQAQRDGLQHVVLLLTDGAPPRCDGEGNPLIGHGFGERLQRRLRGEDDRAALRRRTTSKLREHRVDVVLAQYGNTAQALLPACAAAGVPLIAHFHGFDAFTRSVIEKEKRYAELWRQAVGVVAVSEAMGRQLVALGADSRKLLVNPCGVDADRFAPMDASVAPPHFIGVGRFVEKKAPLIAIMAFEQAAKLRPDARLTLIGDGPMREACLQYVRARRLGAQVSLPGAMGHEGVAAAMQGARAFVQHSVQALSGDSEGTPVAVLEAMASALPVVATRHMGIAEVVNDASSGLLSAEFDVEAMAANLLRLIDDPMLARDLGQEGRRLALAHHRIADRNARLQAFIEQCVRA